MLLQGENGSARMISFTNLGKPLNRLGVSLSCRINIILLMIHRVMWRRPSAVNNVYAGYSSEWIIQSILALPLIKMALPWRSTINSDNHCRGRVQRSMAYRLSFHDSAYCDGQLPTDVLDGTFLVLCW